jgi:DNA polymerase-3 subunit delta
MKVEKGRGAAAAPKASAPALRIALFYGPEIGLARERADTLAKSVVPDPADPFRVVALTGEQLAQDPARLADEAAAIAFGGGRKVVRVTDAPKGLTGQRQTQILRDFIAAPAGDALVIVEAGDLRKDHALVKAAEAAKHAQVARCYPDDEAAIETVIVESLA